MPTLATLAHRLTSTVTLFADTPADALRIDYYPGAFNASALETWNATADHANAATTEEEGLAAAHEFATLICRILAGWNLTDDDGETPMPLTPERIIAEFQRQPLVWPAFLQTVFQAIAEHISQGKATGTPASANSAPTSSPTGSVAMTPESLNPSASSSSRAGSKAGRPSNGSSRTRSGSRPPTSAR